MWLRSGQNRVRFDVPPGLSAELVEEVLVKHGYERQPWGTRLDGLRSKQFMRLGERFWWVEPRIADIPEWVF